MILVDTSVLIDFLKGSETEEVNKLNKILISNIPFGICDFIYMELLQGVKTEREFEKLKKYLDTQTFYKLKNDIDSYANAAMIYFKSRQKGITIRSMIDLLIAQTAIENNLLLLHSDKDYTNIKKIVTDLNFY